ncbi:MAG: HEAT repeat domain-containing protein [Candidatus Acidiferrales bacterium]
MHGQQPAIQDKNAQNKCLNPAGKLRVRGWRRLKIFASAFGALVVFTLVQGATVRAAWAKIASIIQLDSDTAATSPAQISAYSSADLAAMPAQQQAELLMQESINHNDGAANLVPQYTDLWTGKLTLTPELSGTLGTALNANDLHVRADALEVYLAAYKIPKTRQGAQQLTKTIANDPKARPWALWMLGALGNRGIEPDRALAILSNYLHDPDEQTRYWAVEGLAHLGTYGTIAPLLDAFRNDPSAEVRERAAGSLAQTGMLNPQQRMNAVPPLIEMAADPSLDATEKSWIYQALSEITGERLGHDPIAWRNWWVEHQPR